MFCCVWIQQVVRFHMLHLYVVLDVLGDQVGPEASSEVLCGAGHVVQVPAGSLLRPLVHLPAHLRPGGERQGARTAHGVRRPQTHGEPQGGAAGRGETPTGSKAVLGLEWLRVTLYESAASFWFSNEYWLIWPVSFITCSSQYPISKVSNETSDRFFCRTDRQNPKQEILTFKKNLKPSIKILFFWLTNWYN